MQLIGLIIQRLSAIISFNELETTSKINNTDHPDLLTGSCNKTPISVHIHYVQLVEQTVGDVFQYVHKWAIIILDLFLG